MLVIFKETFLLCKVFIILPIIGTYMKETVVRVQCPIILQLREGILPAQAVKKLSCGAIFLRHKPCASMTLLSVCCKGVACKVAMTVNIYTNEHSIVTALSLSVNFKLE